MISIAFIFRLGRQHFNKYLLYVCLLRRNLCESQGGVLWGSTGVNTKGHLGRSFHAGGCSKEQRHSGTSLISGSKHLNAGRMQTFEEYLSLASSDIRTEKDYQNHPQNKVVKNPFCATYHAGHFILLHKMHKIDIIPTCTGEKPRQGGIQQFVESN